MRHACSARAPASRCIQLDRQSLRQGCGSAARQLQGPAAPCRTSTRGGRCAARLEADALAALYPIRPYPNPYNHHYLDRCAARLEADALAALADAAAALRQRAAIERGVHQVGIG